MKLPPTWHIHNVLHVSLLKIFKGDPRTQPIEEDPPKFDEQEEIIQLETTILKHGDNVLQSGRNLCRYLLKFKNYAHEDAKWMQESHMKCSLDILQEYTFLYGFDNA